MLTEAPRPSGNPCAPDELVVQHLYLVRIIAVKLQRQIMGLGDLDELISAGMLGLYDAATKYQPDRNVPFVCYAKSRIRGEMLDSLRKLDVAPRELRRKQRRVEEGVRDLSQKLGRIPTEEEVAGHLGMDVKQYRNISATQGASDLLSERFQRATGEGNNLAGIDLPDESAIPADEACARAQLRGALQSAINTLPAQCRTVLMLYHSGGHTMREIAGLVGLGESRISQIYRSALAKMRVSLERENFHGSLTP